MKFCRKCNKEKQFIEFTKDSDKKDGYRAYCSDCYNAERREARKSIVHTITVEKYTCHKCEIEKPISGFHKNKGHPSGLSVICKECRVEKSKRHYERHRDKIIERVSAYVDNNPDKIRESRKKYQKRKMKEDPMYVMTRRLRNRLYYALKKKFWKKDTKFFQYIGCTLEELKTHLEKQFQPGMTWENRNLWHIDHKTPLISAETEEELYSLCHYTNLQPMWGPDNIRKGSKVEE